MHKRSTGPWLATLLMALACTGAQAQAVFRIVGPDGKVTFSDRPPAEGAAEPARTANRSGGSPNDVLPYELRQVASRFPVTLYTGNDCAPCTSARNLLTSRGVPFTERTVTTNEDIAALQRLSGNASLPFGTIGGQHLDGFSEAEWVRYLDAAGYPKQSQLPRNYRAPAPTPLVGVTVAAPAGAAAGSAAASGSGPARARPSAPPPAVAPARSPSNPAGIIF